MKIQYKYIITLIGFIVCYTNHIEAQVDTTLNRKVSVEREFTPIIQDATKINTLPELQESIKPTTGVGYVTDLPQIEFKNFPIIYTGSGEAATDIVFNQKRGYALFGIGHNLNMEGKLGYRIVDAETDRLDLFGSWNSANNDIDYLKDYFALRSARAKSSDTFLKAKYKHKFESLDFHLNASYLNSMFNYYGNLFSSSFPTPDLFDEKNNINFLNADLAVKSDESNEFFYAADLGYRHFASSFINDKYNGGIFDGNFNMGSAFDTDKKVGVMLGALHQSYNKIGNRLSPDSFHKLTILKAGAYFEEEGDIWKLSLGAKMNYAIDVKNKFVIAPDITASLIVAERNKLYTTISGGINENTFYQTFLENRYVRNETRVGYSSTLFDAVLGINVGALDAFEFDAFAGYKYTKDDHLYISYFTGSLNQSHPVYANIGESTIGGVIKTLLIPYTDLSVKAQVYTYNVKFVNDRYNPQNLALQTDKKKAWGKPTYSLDINVDVTPIQKLRFSANYIHKGGRKTYFKGQSLSMKDITELNLKAEYDFIDWLSANLKFNNVLNQQYETLFGYTHQGFNVMGGVSLKF